jgi:hypothetical protein
MKNLIIVLFTFIMITVHGQNTCTEKVFMKEYPSKIIGHCNLALVIIKDSTIKFGGSYNIIYKDSVITKITKWTDTIKHKFYILDCILYLDNQDKRYYDSKNFNFNDYNLKLYSMIDKDFLTLTNDLRIERLERRFVKLNEKK